MIIPATRPYYQVGSRIFYSKVEALIEATQTNVHPTWHFADHVWSAINWQQDFNRDLRELYYGRARQLREMYDYIVISYSGGSDSRTVLDSFLKQGLHVDEILHAWPRAATKDIYKISTDHDNFLSEYDLVLNIARSLIQKQKCSMLGKKRPVSGEWKNLRLPTKMEDCIFISWINQQTHAV